MSLGRERWDQDKTFYEMCDMEYHKRPLQLSADHVLGDDNTPALAATLGGDKLC